MKTFIISVDQPIAGRMLAKATQANEIAPELIDAWDRTIFEWDIHSTKETRPMTEVHEDALVYHKGGKSFWFDGGENGNISQRRFLGYGDGARVDFQIPYRWVYAPSLVMTVDNVVNGAWTLTESSGIVRFTSAPALHAQVHADRFKCRFKAYFVVEGMNLYETLNQFKSWESRSIKIREFPH